jgi:chromosomal replication initiator protein
VTKSETKKKPKLNKTIKKELGSEGRLEYSIVMENNFNNSRPFTVKFPTNNKKELKNPSVSMPIDLNQNSIRNPFIIPGLKKVNVESQLNPNYSFENLVEGDCNRLARSAGFAVANKPGGTAFNPLLIYGAVGLGKTHLAHAIGIQIKNEFPNKTVLYVSSEKFTQQYIDSVRNNNQNDFVHFYQMIDVLIIDDVQYFAGKEKTQDVFFHIFNHLHQTGKQLILTSDKPPIELKGLEQRLLSRFKWGLTADLQIPDFETKMNILSKKIYKDGIDIPEEVLEYIASHINSNVRELEGALISLLAQATLNKKEINIDLAIRMINKLVKCTVREITVDYITKVVCDYFSLTPDSLHINTRKREIVQARQIAMFFSKNLTKSSLAAIGTQIGGKDHATVLHACRTVANLKDTDKNFRVFLDAIENKLKF